MWDLLPVVFTFHSNPKLEPDTRLAARD
jgi:hypothetical protein